MRCPNCGNENPPDYVFCDECGARLQEGEGTESSPEMATLEGSTPLSESDTSSAQSQEAGQSSKMVVTPILDNTPQAGDEPQVEALSTPVSDETSGDSEGAALEDEIPVTEDTMAAPQMGADNMTDDGSGLSAQPMPDVVEIGSLEESTMAAENAERMEPPMSAPDVSPAASGTPAVADDGASTGWATTAIQHLDEAQQAMAKGDYVGYGQSLGNLRSLLESIVSGTGTGTGVGASESMSSGSAYPVEVSQDDAQSSVTSDATSADSLGSIPMVEPAAEAGTLAAEAEAPTSQEEATPTVSGGTPLPAQDEPPAVARLVVISTGAELPLPEQEEISVGREDPSSGIFPDVDL